MSTLERDADLPLPDPPAAVPFAGLRDAGLARPGGGTGPLRLDGGRGWALWTRGGAWEWTVDGDRLVRGMEWSGGVTVNQVVSPGLVRREVVHGGETLEECVLVAPALPLLALQRRSGQDRADRSRDAEAEVALTLLPGASAVRLHHDGSVLVVRPGGGTVAVAAVLVRGSGWTVEEDPDEGVRATGRVRTDEDGVASLLLVAGPATELGRVLAAAAHLPAHALRATSAPRDGVRLSTGVRSLDDGVDWARTRVEAAARLTTSHLEPSSALGEEARFWTRLGLLAAGGGEDIRAGSPRWPEVGAGGLDPLEGWLDAHHTMVTGDPSPALRQADALLGSADAASSPDHPHRLVALALHHLADALRHGADEGTREALRRRANAADADDGAEPSPSPRRRGSKGVRLPMVGQGVPDSEDAIAAAMAALLAGQEPPTVPPEWRTDAPLLGAWADALAGGPDDAWTVWRTVLEEGLEGGRWGPGRWDGEEIAPHAPAAGQLLAALVHGIVGWHPDAPSGRAILRPRLPRHLTRLRVEGLPVGDVRVRFDYERLDPGDNGLEHRMRVEPTAGRAPATLVWEPRFEGVRTVRSVRVDGRPADLELREDSGGLVVPVQVALDAPRTLEVVLEEVGQSSSR